MGQLYPDPSKGWDKRTRDSSQCWEGAPRITNELMKCAAAVSKQAHMPESNRGPVLGLQPKGHEAPAHNHYLIFKWIHISSKYIFKKSIHY